MGVKIPSTGCSEPSWASYIRALIPLVHKAEPSLQPSSTRGPSVDMESTSTLILDFLGSRTVRNSFLLSTDHLVDGILFQQPGGLRQTACVVWRLLHSSGRPESMILAEGICRLNHLHFSRSQLFRAGIGTEGHQSHILLSRTILSLESNLVKQIQKPDQIMCACVCMYMHVCVYVFLVGERRRVTCEI